MRIDPTAVFFHTIASVPVRVCSAWVVGTLGAFTPIFIGHGRDALAVIGWQILFFPFYLFLIAVFSGWWSFVAVPLLVAFAWRVLVFLREDGFITDLLWIFVLPFLIGIRASADAWPIAAVLAGLGAIYLIKQQRKRALRSV